MQAERVLVATPEPLCVPRDVAAAMLDLSPNTFEAQVQAGKLPKPIQFGRRLVWSVDALRAAVDELAGRASPFQVQNNVAGGWGDVGKNAVRRRPKKR